MYSKDDVKTALIVSIPAGIAHEANKIRAAHDKAFERWMPHINLLFPFAPEESFAVLVPVLQRALADVKPFPLRFDGVSHFTQKDCFVAWLSPCPETKAALQDVYEKVTSRVPWASGGKAVAPAHNFEPHCTLGQFPLAGMDKAAVEAQCAVLFDALVPSVAEDTTTVFGLQMISRGADTPFQLQHNVPFKTPLAPPIAGGGPAGAVANGEVFNLGPLGALVEIHIPAQRAAAAGRRGAVLPHPVVILDRSGSMGSWCDLTLTQAVPDALAAVGYHERQPCSVITFDSVVERVRAPSGADPTLCHLRQMSFKCRGCTQMHGAVLECERVLHEHAANDVMLVVVSDGVVSDMDDSVRAADGLAQTMRGRYGMVSVALVRLMTSSDAKPDTRALSCFGALSSEGNVPVVDAHTPLSRPSLNRAKALQQLTEVLVESIHVAEKVEVSAPRAVLRRFPTDPAATSLQVAVGATANVLLTSMEEAAHLLVDGAPLLVTTSSVPLTEARIVEFLQGAEQRLRMWRVMGGMQAETEEALRWFETLEGCLTPMVTDIDSASDMSVSARDRAQRVLQEVVARRKSVVASILQLKNVDKLNTFNSKQQADFLRGLVDASSSRAVARRAMKRDGEELDYDAMVSDAVAAALGKLSTIVADGNALVSFYSQESLAEVLRSIEAFEGATDELRASDVLRIVGGVGLAFRAPKGNYPDPWTFRVHEVYMHAYLSECDIIGAVKHGVKLQCPGRAEDAPVTGVVPVYCAEEDGAWNAYHTTLLPVAELHAGVTLRGTLARVPQDALARDAAALYCMCRQVGPLKAVTEVEAMTLQQLLHVVTRHGGFYNGVVGKLNGDGPRAWLTGDQGFSSPLKALTALMGCRGAGRMIAEQPARAAAALRAIYAYDAYLAARRHFYNGGAGMDATNTARFAEFYETLGVNFSSRQLPVQGVFEDEVDTQPDTGFDVAYAMARAAALEWMPKMDHYAAVMRVAVGVAGGDTVTPALAPMTVADAFGTADVELLCLDAAATAIRCAHEDDVVDTATRTLKRPMCENRAELMELLQNDVKHDLEKDYHKRLAVKLAQEREQKATVHAMNLVMVATPMEFVKGMREYPNQSAAGFQNILGALLDLSKADIPCRLEKLWVLLVARTNAGVPVWNGGNVYVGDTAPFAAAFMALDPTGERWERAMAMRRKFGRYHYRDSGMANRHGHSDDHPSFYAYGFQTLEAFQKAVSADEFKKYAEEHPHCCGFHSSSKAPATTTKKRLRNQE